MPDDDHVDHYETLQISPNADADTIHRVYRLLAQRFHPDNRETGNARRFLDITHAFDVLGDPVKRAQFDTGYIQRRQSRWRLVASGQQSENDFELEQRYRLTVLEVLYTKRRIEPDDPGIFDLDLEQLLGRPREQLEFTFWYLMQKQFMKRSDGSRLMITAEGVDYLEQNYEAALQRRIAESSEVA